MMIDRGILADKSVQCMVPMPEMILRHQRNCPKSQVKDFDLASNLRAVIGCLERAIRLGWKSAEEWQWRLESMLDDYAEPLAAAGIVVRIIR